MDRLNAFLETTLTQDLILPLGQYLLIPLIILGVTYIVVQKGIEKYKHENVKELKVDDYYNEVSKETLINLVKDWTDLIQQTDVKMHMMSLRAKKDLPKYLILEKQTNEEVELNNGTSIEKVSPETYAVGKLIMETWIYGKRRTNKLLSKYQQHNFKGSITEKNKDHDTKSIVYMAMIIVNLRKDLMNIESDPLELLELKINDISEPENKKKYEEMVEEIRNEIYNT